MGPPPQRDGPGDTPAAPSVLIVVGASAGGVDALKAMVPALSPGLPAAIVVVLHVAPYSPSALPAILRRRCPLPTEQARHLQPLSAGRVYVAPPDYHVVVVDDALVLSHGPRENGHRPSIDVLFRSAALWGHGLTIGVVLSGALDDGSAGLAAIKAEGGTAIVQDPADAMFPNMPENALQAVEADYVAPAGEVGQLLDRLSRAAVVRRSPAPQPRQQGETVLEEEVSISQMRPARPVSADPVGSASGFSCPDCHGSLFEIGEGGALHYRCRTGHAWSRESLLVQQGETVESALWNALRALEEKASLSSKMAQGARQRGNLFSAERLSRVAKESAGAGQTLRQLFDELTDRLSEGDGTGSAEQLG